MFLMILSATVLTLRAIQRSSHNTNTAIVMSLRSICTYLTTIEGSFYLVQNNVLEG
jgi:uncharacterized membrane protein (GlpM family)